MRRLVRLSLLTLGMALLAAGCGWHPRGGYELPPELDELRLSSEQPDHELLPRLRRGLSVAGVRVVEAAEPGAFSLHIGPLRRDRRDMSLDPQARAAEMGLWLSVSFDLRDPDGVPVFGPMDVSANRIYNYDPNNVIAKEDEERVIDQELQDNLVGQIFRQLRRLDPAILQRPAAGATPAS